MARGPRLWDEKIIERFEAEGRGCGHFEDYKPWLTVNDVSSRGRSRRVWGHKTKREHHLLSDVEYRLFLLLEWADDVVDIREQYPLDRLVTMQCARELGVKHPYYPGTRTVTVMSCDFLVTRRSADGKTYYQAFNAKCSDEAENARAKEKLDIQTRFFEHKRIEHLVVLDTNLPTAVIGNIEWARGGALNPYEVEPGTGFFDFHLQNLVRAVSGCRPSVHMKDFCQQYDASFGLERGTALRIMRLAILRRELVTNMACTSLVDEPISNFSSPEKRTASLRRSA